MNGYLLSTGLLLPFLGSLAAMLLPTNARNAAAWLAGGIAVACFAIFAPCFAAVTAEGIVSHEFAWLPTYGLTLTIRLDGLAWLFAVLVTVIGGLVILYARYYMSPLDPVPRFYAFLLMFMGAMLGIVVSGNLIQLVFFWELTSFASFLLIGYWHHNAPSRDGARIALIVTATGGLALFAGVLILGHIVGSYELGEILSAGDRIRAHELYGLALVLVAAGALTKSAQFPFQFWLPHAMAAPTPVSAYLHSAAMVKAGVFVLIRLWPALGGTTEWLWLIGTAGLATFVIGAFYAIFQQDLKGLLAYSTISHLGLITLLIGLDSPLAIVAAIFHVVNHATFKASLFMAAGIIDHETGTRDLRLLSGLWRHMPITTTLAMVAAASMAGVPLLNGFLSKEMFFAETVETHDGSFLDDALPYIATLAGAFSVCYSLRFIHDAFFGPEPRDLPRQPHEPPRWMRFPVELLVFACLVVGTIPGMTIGPFLDTAVRSVLGPLTPTYSLAIWHGFTPAVAMSLIALLAGSSLYILFHRQLQASPPGPPLLRRLPEQRLFSRAIVAVSWRGASGLERLLGAHGLQPQLRLVVLVSLAAALSPIWLNGFGWGDMRHPIDVPFTLVWVVGIACAVTGAIMTKFHRLAALLIVSGAGLAVCITFLWLSAPDLALTQLLIEIVTTVLILLGLRWLPKRIPGYGSLATMPISTWLRRGGDLSIAVLVGGGLFALSYAMMTRPLPPTISSFFLERAYVEGGGTNVVNVILVDFRGFDTLGEITVVAVVALTVFALLRRFRPAADSLAVPEQQRIQDVLDERTGGQAPGDTVAQYLAVPSIIMKILLPFVTMFGVYLFLRGHDAPGGGFVAGLAIASGLLVQYMASGIRFVETYLRVHPLRWMAAGLLVALATGAGSWLVDHPFLTATFRYLELPLIGRVPIASALLFDFGVMALVFGATILILIAFAHQSVRSHRISAPAQPQEPPRHVRQVPQPALEDV